jgi:hypothetical protein
MNDLITAVVIGAISQMIFLNLTKNSATDVSVNTGINFNSLIYVGISVFAVTTLYNLSLKNKHITQLLLEALAVGVMTLVAGKISTTLVAELIRMTGMSTPYGNEMVLVVTGILIHLVSEFAGVNKWYVTNGVAAM